MNGSLLPPDAEADNPCPDPCPAELCSLGVGTKYASPPDPPPPKFSCCGRSPEEDRGRSYSSSSPLEYSSSSLFPGGFERYMTCTASYLPPASSPPSPDRRRGRRDRLLRSSARTSLPARPGGHSACRVATPISMAFRAAAAASRDEWQGSGRDSDGVPGAAAADAPPAAVISASSGFWRVRPGISGEPPGGGDRTAPTPDPSPPCWGDAGPLPLICVPPPEPEAMRPRLRRLRPMGAGRCVVEAAICWFVFLLGGCVLGPLHSPRSPRMRPPRDLLLGVPARLFGDWGSGLVG